MRIHSEFLPLKKSAVRIAQQLNEPGATDGAFARVCFDGDMEVLKATSCPATNRLFEALYRCKVKGAPVPEALPAVFKRHGDIVRDSEDFVYTVWSVERLFSAGEDRIMQRARIAAKQRYQVLKPKYAFPATRQHENDMPGLRRALEQEQVRCESPNTWQGSADIALSMSLRTAGELRRAFQFLLEFVRTEKVQLDLLTRGNVMLNMFGMPCLGDPVCDDERQVQPPGLVQGTCMAALVPTGVWGIGNLQLEPTSTLPLDESTLEGMERDLKALGVTPLRMQWGSEEHRKFLTQVPPPQSIWALPDAAKNLRADCYARLFSG